MTGETFSARSVRFPAAYGAPGGPESLLPWSHVEERMRERGIHVDHATVNRWVIR